jgi:hypothetical protein
VQRGFDRGIVFLRLEIVYENTSGNIKTESDEGVHL